MPRDDDQTRVRIESPEEPGGATQSYGLPDELVDRAHRNMAGIAAAFGVLVLVGIGVNWLLSQHSGALAPFGGGDMPMPLVPTVARVWFVVASGALVWVMRTPTLGRQVKTDLGLGYEVFTSGIIGITELTMLPAMGLPVGTISGVSLWILLTRMMAPTTLGRAVVVSGLSACTLPLVIWGAAQSGQPSPDTMVTSGLVKTTFGAAVMAVVASRVLYRLGTAITRAREMGSYVLEERLGVGGMGEVWRATHRLIQRPAAIKLVRPEALGQHPAGSAGLVARFEQEARATAALQSAHTITLYDYGRTRDGRFYYVMELLDGLDLQTLVQRHGPIDAGRTVFLLRQICHSLAEAHAHGLVHRDIKPANIFLCRQGLDYDHVKVLDFGLVKRDVAAARDDGVALTQAGMVHGTPSFIAPEQALGRPQIDGQADVYAVGCVAYWLLTGQLVFDEDSPMALVVAHIEHTPVPPSQRTELEVPAALEAVVLRCLAKDPSERPAGAGALSRELEQLACAGAWDADAGERWWRKHMPGSVHPD